MSERHLASTPFDDIRSLISGMPSADEQMHGYMLDALGAESEPLRYIGDLDQSMAWLASWQSRSRPAIERPLVAVFVGAHEVANYVRGIDPVIGAKARVKLMTQGPASVRAVAATHQAAYKVYEFGIEVPCADFTQKPSLSERDCAAAIAFGMEVVAEGADLIVLGGAGFGSATAAAAIARGLYGGQTEYWAGGAGDIAQRRIEVIDKAAKLHSAHLSDPLDVLARLGGRDLAGMVGAIIAARHQRIPVLLDGFVVCAAAAILHKIDPHSLDHCFAAHLTAEPAHGALLDRIGKTPLLDMKIGTGDGTGGAIALGTLKAAAAATSLIMENRES